MASPSNAPGPLSAGMNNNTGHPNDRAAEQPKPSLKTWFRRLTTHTSSNPDTGASQLDTAMHQQPYVPRHAHRDAMLAMPLHERKRNASVAENANAVKAALPGDILPMHPNQRYAVHMKRLSSGNVRRSWGGSASASASGSGSGPAGLGSIKEDAADDLEHEPDMMGGGGLGSASTSESDGGVQRPAAARVHRNRITTQRRYTSYPTPASAALAQALAAGDSSSSPNYSTTPSPRTSATFNGSLSSTEMQRRLQDVRQQSVARQLREHVSPSRPLSALVEDEQLQLQSEGEMWFQGGLVAGPVGGGGNATEGARGVVRGLVERWQAEGELGVVGSSGKGKGRAVDESWLPPSSSGAESGRASFPSLASTFRTALELDPIPSSEEERSEQTPAAHDVDVSAYAVPDTLPDRSGSVETIASPTDTAWTSDVDGPRSSVTSLSVSGEEEEQGGLDEVVEEGMKEGERDAGDDDDGKTEFDRALEAL